MIKTDCFAYHHKLGECSALYGTYCEIGECSFYKSRDDYEEECLRCDARNHELGIMLADGRPCKQLQQEHFADVLRKLRKGRR